MKFIRFFWFFKYCFDFEIKDSLKYTHYGEVYKRVDMRAEVGLKTRYIHITSEVSDGNSNGGHVKVSELNVHVIDHGSAIKRS